MLRQTGDQTLENLIDLIGSSNSLPINEGFEGTLKFRKYLEENIDVLIEVH